MWISKVSNNELVDINQLRRDASQFGTGFEEPDPDAPTPFAAPWAEETIPRHEWADRIESLERTDSLLSQTMNRKQVPILDQGRTNYCWMNGVVDAIHAYRVRAGLPTLHFSPASAACKIKNFRNQGGWGSEAIEGINQWGICTVDYWPQSTINQKYDNVESKEARARFRIPEYNILPRKDFAAIMTALLKGHAVPAGLLWWGHLVDFVDPLVRGRDAFGVRFRNSWSDRWGEKGYGILEEGKATADEAVVVRTFTLDETC